MFLIIALLCLLVFGLVVFLAARFVYNHFQNKNNPMEISKTKITQSFTFKGITIAILVLLLLIPGSMIQDLIQEREQRSNETILKINDKWSLSQTLAAPLLAVPYTTTLLDKDKRAYTEEHTLYITPKDLKIRTELTPEERHYGIYKAILYKSDLHFSGNFSSLKNLKIDNSLLHFDKAFVAIGITDLRGVTQNPVFKLNRDSLEATVGVLKFFDITESIEVVSARKYSDYVYTTDRQVSGKTLIINLNRNIQADSLLAFDCTMKLNGSGSINFIPIGQTTSVEVSGSWKSPSFVGKFSPESEVTKQAFNAKWNILSFNREIPEMWSDGDVSPLGNNSFGVNLIETVDNYQQNMRSAKYALMFIALTFIVFFFVEIFTKRPIHFFQYLLVGIALVLFYALLLSFSEQIGFGLAYLIAGAATVLLTTVYFYSLIKEKTPTIILAGVLIALYTFLYVILQLEDLALLIGSVFLFVTLGVIMFVSNKIRLGNKMA